MYGRNKYRQTQADTATPGELVVMLYDGIVRFVGEAISANEADDVKTMGLKLTRAIDIIAYLQSTLREDVAPELVAALDRVYCSWTAILVGANIMLMVPKKKLVANCTTPIMMQANTYTALKKREYEEVVKCTNLAVPDRKTAVHTTTAQLRTLISMAASLVPKRS